MSSRVTFVYRDHKTETREVPWSDGRPEIYLPVYRSPHVFDEPVVSSAPILIKKLTMRRVNNDPLVYVESV